MKGIAGAYVMPIALGSVGGIALNLAWSKLAPKLPTSVQGGWAAVGVKSIFAIAAVMMLGRFLPRYRRQLQMAGVGAVFLSAAPPLMSLISSKVPGLSGYIDYQSYAMPGARLHGYMASRTLGSLEDLYSPAAVIQPPGTAVPRQFGALSGYIAVQPHMGGGSGLMGYDWQNDGM